VAAPVDTMLLWFELFQLQERYITVLDTDALEEWPELFTEDCHYEIVPKENADLGLPVGLIHCDNQRMLRDRVVSLRHANIFEAHSNRHLTSGLTLAPVDAGTVDMQSSYVVVQTRSNGESTIYQAGRYFDRVVRTPAGWRYRSKRVVYDTSRVQTLLATPI
jgi:anthranilate 1,2-dioxygenase small subunit